MPAILPSRQGAAPHPRSSPLAAISLSPPLRQAPGASTMTKRRGRRPGPSRPSPQRVAVSTLFAPVSSAAAPWEGARLLAQRVVIKVGRTDGQMDEHLPHENHNPRSIFSFCTEAGAQAYTSLHTRAARRPPRTSGFSLTLKPWLPSGVSPGVEPQGRFPNGRDLSSGASPFQELLSPPPCLPAPCASRNHSCQQLSERYRFLFGCHGHRAGQDEACLGRERRDLCVRARQ